MIASNVWYSSRRAAEWLSDPELLWGLKILAEKRRCYSEVLRGLQNMEGPKITEAASKCCNFQIHLILNFCSVLSIGMLK